MLATKAILRERIRLILSGGKPSDRDRVFGEQIDQAISDVANLLLKTTVLQNQMEQGFNSVDGAALATYENIPVSRDVNWEKVRTAKITLPVRPMMLPNGMGINMVYPSGMPHLAFKYIPMDMFNSWMSNRVVAPLHKKFYTNTGTSIIIYDDLFGAGYTSVDLRLVITDISQAGENDPLPLLPEHVDTIIGSVITRFKGEPDTNRRETDQPSPSQRN